MPDHQITILCIDDNPTNRYVVQRHLEAAGFRVTEADSGEAGLQAITTSPPDLIILDVRLPDISGFEVCQRLKENPATASIPVLHLSAAYTRSQDRAQGLEMGADAYLMQPVEAVELLATVRALLRLYQAEQTAQRQSREWQATFDAMNDGVCLLDAGGHVLRCNRAIETLLNQPCEALRHRHYFDLVPLQAEPNQPDPGSGELLSAESLHERLSFARLQETGQRIRVEVPWQQPSNEASGEAGWVAVTLDAIWNEAGIFTGAVYLVTDITLQKRATVEREHLLLREQEARSASEAANRLKDEFLATLSHELRSPLNAIMGWTKLLRTRTFNAIEATQALEIIERNTRTQTQLIEDLLDVSRIIQGKLRLKVQPTNLAAVIESAIETVRPAADAKSIRVSFNDLVAESASSNSPLAAAPSAHLMVLGDSDRLQQILWNLLSNAVKFTPKGGQIEVKLQQIDGDTLGKPDRETGAAAYAQITVTDTGKGIPPEFLPHVFDRFRQGDSSITRKYGGLGLGLSIVRHLVELHGGNVAVSSLGESQGATFGVQLPLLPQAADSPTSQTVDAMPSLAGLRILVVDDEIDSRTYITTLLELYGATVLAVDSAQGVPQMLQNTPVDILVSDIGMPDEDGYSLIRQVKLLPAEQIPITVALTGYARSEDRERALAEGFQTHLTKPIEPQTLVQTLAALSQRSS